MIRVTPALHDYDTITTPYFAMSGAVGYAYPVFAGIYLDPRVYVSSVFVSGAYTQVVPTVGVTYRF